MGEPQAPVADAAAQRRRDRVAGLLILSIAFCSTLCISWWAKLEAAPEAARPPPEPSPDGLEGFPSAVDPIQALEVVRTKTPRDQFRGFVAQGVKSDGTVDVGGAGSIRYVFQSLEGKGPQPQRKDLGPPRQLYCGKQTVQVKANGVVVEPDVSSVTCPAHQVDPLPDPRCGPREVWAHALKKGAPQDGLARVEYYRAQLGPAWRFTIPRSPHHRFSLYGDCDRELTPSEAVGAVR